MSAQKTYIQYGVPSNWAARYARLNLPVTTFKTTSTKNLTARYDIPEHETKFVKACLSRKPIDEDVYTELLKRSRYVCCLCRGNKSDAYIIHHIQAYSVTQDNSYNNLAVLCPNDHDLVHREGQKLTNSISAKEVEKAKMSWEKRVEELDVQTASQHGEIGEVDFISVPRILGLYNEIHNTTPNSKFSRELLEIGAITEDGNIHLEFVIKHNKNPSTPLNFFGPSGSWKLSIHYTEIFKSILKKVEFEDLDSLLTKKNLAQNNLVSRFCFYVGGLYGKRPQLPVDESTPPTTLYFHRRGFWIEWLVDAKYMVSNTALHRLGIRTEYLVYGRIRSVDLKIDSGKKYVSVDIRPYLFGIPLKTKSRRPAIHFLDKYQDIDFEND